MNYPGWENRPLVAQCANIGSEVSRAIRWRTKKNQEYARLAFFRALELIDLTLQSSKNAAAMKELARVRSALVDDFAGDNTFHSTDRAWQRYFDAFARAANML